MNKPVLFVYLSENCGGCKNFKTKLPSIKEKVKDHVSEVIEVYQKTLSISDWNKDAPAVLKSHVTQFPSIFLLNAGDYKRKSNELRFKKLDGKDVVAWVEAHAKDPELLATGMPIKTPGPAPTSSTKKELAFSLSTSPSGVDACSRAYKLTKSAP
jgi:hypothetical protein